VNDKGHGQGIEAELGDPEKNRIIYGVNI